jgi:hypothetical protein
LSKTHFLAGAASPEEYCSLTEFAVSRHMDGVRAGAPKFKSRHRWQ